MTWRRGLVAVLTLSLLGIAAATFGATTTDGFWFVWCIVLGAIYCWYAFRSGYLLYATRRRR